MSVHDGVQFETTSVRVGTIRNEARYGGVRVDMKATLDKARIALQVDVGFGDAVTPAPRTMIYPGLLPDVPTRSSHPDRCQQHHSHSAGASESLHAVPLSVYVWADRWRLTKTNGPASHEADPSC